MITIIIYTLMEKKSVKGYHKKSIEIAAEGGKKITNYFETGGKEDEDPVIILNHDHAYSNTTFSSPPKSEKQSNLNILTPLSCMSKLSSASIQIKSSSSKIGKKKTIKKSSTQIKLNSSTKTNKLLTDYFPVRRSVRKCHSKLLTEKKKDFEEAILTRKEDGLKVESFVDKGRGVKATKRFHRGDFVVEYTGELITLQEAKWRERVYATDENTGCYMYYFTLNNKHYCVDATAESKHLGRLINHSRHGNLATKPFVIDDVPHLILIAKCDIEPGEELLYDYGDRNKNSLIFHPWLAT